MSVKVEDGEGELASSSLWLPSPLLQGNPAVSASRSSMGASTGSKALRPGDWRRAAAAETGGEPVQAPSCDLRYPDITPNIDDVHSPASVNFDNGADPRTASPLVPRALAPSSGLGDRGSNTSPAGHLAAGRQLDSPASIVSLDVGEASFRLDSPELDGPIQDASPSEMSPVRPRRVMPVDSELSTPGSDGYASPSVLFVIGPSSLMRSSVQNPLYVERPTPSEGDIDVAKALVMSPCADRSPASKPPRCTLESVWSSPTTSADQSISLNPPQQDDKLSPLPHLEATSSPAASNMRKAVPPLLRMDLETPRRIIKNLSMSQDMVYGVSNAGGARALSLRGQRNVFDAVGAEGLRDSLAGDTAVTPCSTAMSGRVEQAPASATAAGAAEGNITWVCNPSAPDLRADKAALQHPGSSKTASVVGGTNGQTSLDLDDTIGAGRTLDQTPRKASRVSSCRGDQQQPSAVKGTPNKRHGEPKPAQQVPRSVVSVNAGPRGAKPSGGLLRMVSWILLITVVVLIGSRIGSIERWSPPHSAMRLTVFKAGPVCFRELYPGANSELLAARSTTLFSVNATRFREPVLAGFVAVPFCWRQLPNCHILDDLLSSVPKTSVPPVTALSDEANATVAAAGPAAALADCLAAEDYLGVALDEPSAPAVTGIALDMQLGHSGDDGMGQLSGILGDSLLLGTSAVGFGTEAMQVEPAVQELPQQPHPYEQAAAAMVDNTIAKDRDFAATTMESAAQVSEPESGLPDRPDDAALGVSVAAAEEPLQCLAVPTGSDDVALAGMDVAVEQPVQNPGVPSRSGNNVALTCVEAPAIDSFPGGDAAAVQSFAVPTEPLALPGSGVGQPAEETTAAVDSPASATAATDAGDTAEALVVADPVADSAVKTLPVIPTLGISTGGGHLDATSAVHSVFAARFYGWTLSELLLGAVTACLAGGLLAWTIERLGSHMHRRQRVVTRDDSEICATQQPSLPAGRILRFKHPQGDARVEEQVALDAVPMQTAVNDGAEREQGTGSFVWRGNKIVYFEG